MPGRRYKNDPPAGRFIPPGDNFSGPLPRPEAAR